MTAGLCRLRCPCCICNQGIRTLYGLPTVARDVRSYGYHPWQHGSSKGFPQNDSHDE
ncbi:hypothetical protein M758_UG326800 [Ceratodon purpureus]|nr:hypothetical protein M758_UG326800 [Ceratodon purpureus]